MKKTLFPFFVFCALFVFPSPSVSAWDDTGHKLTAYIAWQQMTAEARERAAKILLSAPEDSDLSVFYVQDSRSTAAKQRELFMIASTWADIVRDRNFKSRNAKYHHGNWHYLNTFWREVGGKAEIVPDLKSDEQNAVERLFAFDKVLRDRSALDSDKAVALAWILHLGGDIHQPLHDSGRVTEYDPKGDQGGNLFILSPKGATGDDRVTLHWYWDSIIGRNVARLNDACDSAYIPKIAARIMKKHPPEAMRERFKIGKFDEWQQEGFVIASTKLYPNSLKFGEMPSVTYKRMAYNTAQEQIALAGYRMGEMLNQVFGNQELTKAEYEKATAIYASDKTKSSIGQGADDKWIWFKAKSALASINDLRESTIFVDVENSIITLKGTVPNKKQKDLALAAKKKIEGVKQVKDSLKIISN